MFTFFLGVVLFSSCVAQRLGEAGSHDEDLSAYRPKVAPDTATKTSYLTKQPGAKPRVEPTLHQSKQVNTVLDSIASLNQMRKFVDGFTIQIYSGTSREDAMNAKKRMTELPDLTSVLQYNQPKFRVTVGSYYSRLGAQADFQRVKKVFPSSILVPDRVIIK